MSGPQIVWVVPVAPCREGRRPSPELNDSAKKLLIDDRHLTVHNLFRPVSNEHIGRRADVEWEEVQRLPRCPATVVALGTVTRW